MNRLVQDWGSTPVQSLDTRFSLHGEKTSGFDYLRLGLAIAVVTWHSYGLSYGRTAIDAALENPVVAALVYAILPMFFALSGFLVTVSYFRNRSIKTFVVFRSLRIFPALAVEIVLAALLLGPLFTIFSLQNYLQDPKFAEYFLNMAGLIRYELPGVFLDNPYPNVINGALWTVPYELECYIYLVMFMALGLLRRRLFVVLAFVIMTFLVVQLGSTSMRGLIVFIKDQLIGEAAVNPNLQQAANGGVPLTRILVLSLFGGSLMYVLRQSLPFHPVLAAGAAVLGVWLLRPGSYFYAPLPIAHLTIWLGMLTPPKLPLLFSGDYSYGIYLYAFPIQQAVSALKLSNGSYLLHLLISLAVTTMFAVFSWHMIEKPCLRLKSRFLGRRPS